MILTCPVCTTRYLVAEGAIGSSGRRVRCASCGHQWTQEAEIGLDEELFGETPPAFLENMDDDDEFQNDDIGFTDSQAGEPESDDDFEAILRKEIESAPIPKGVRPVPEDEDPVLVQIKKHNAQKKSSRFSPERISGFIVAACFYFCIFGQLLVLQPQISRLWPASNMLYSFVGMHPVLPGEGLTLDELKAEISDGKIAMTGTISNLRSEDTKVPAIMATIVDDNEKPIDHVLIAPPVARLKPEGQTSFDVVYPKIPEGATNVTFAFSFIKADPVKEEHEEKPAGKEEEGAQKEEVHNAEKVPHPPEASHAPAEHATPAEAPAH